MNQEIKKPEWMIKAEQQAAEILSHKLHQLTDKHREQMSKAYPCQHCGGLYSKSTLPPHERKCLDLQERDKKIIEIYDNGKIDAKTISKRLGINHRTVAYVIENNNLQAAIFVKQQEIEQKIDYYYEQGIDSITEIHELIGKEVISRQKIYNYCRKKGYSFPEKNRNKEILEIYHNGQKLSNAHIAKIANVPTVTVSKILKKHNLKGWGTINKEEKNLSEIVLLTYHNGQKLWNTKIAELCGTNNVYVGKILKKNGLEDWYKIGIKEIEEKAIQIFLKNPQIMQKDLAKMVGITRQTLIKILKKYRLK